MVDSSPGRRNRPLCSRRVEFCIIMRISESHPLRRHFAGLVEHAFCTEVGMCNPSLTKYVTDLLVNFTHIDTLNVIRNARGKRIEQIGSMLLVLLKEHPATTVERDRTTYRQIGDYTLFWAGMYPEHLTRSGHHTSDVLLDYVSQGKQSYAIVSQLAREDDTPPSSLFRHLSEDFEYCLYGLGLVRRGWEQSDQPVGDAGGDLVY